MQCRDFLHHYDPCLIAFRVLTDPAEIAFRDVSALPAQAETFLDRSNRVRQPRRVLVGLLQDVEGQTLSGLPANAG